MPHRAPLNAARLAELYDEEPTPVVLELLWEIHRLRATILRAHQVLTSIGHQPAGVPQIVWQTFVQTIEAEPVLARSAYAATATHARAAARRRASSSLALAVELMRYGA